MIEEENSAQVGFENETLQFLRDCSQTHQLSAIREYLDSYDYPDFDLRFPQYRTCGPGSPLGETLPPDGHAWMDVKVKKQSYTLKNWPSIQRSGIAELNAFIVDEEFLSLLQAKARHVYILVRDVPGNRLVLFNRRVFDTMRRIKVNRVTKFNGAYGTKGKLLMNLRWGVTLPQPVLTYDLLDQMIKLAYHVNGMAGEIPSYVRPDRCYVYEDEVIPEEGIERTDEHRNKDVAEK